MRVRFSHNRCKGVVVPVIVVMLVMLLSVAAVTLNLNWLLYHKINAQNSADLSALSALTRIQTDTNIETRINDTKDLGVHLYSLNYDRNSSGISRDEITFGYLEDPNAEEPVFVASEQINSSISAVEIAKPSASQNDVSLFLTNFLGSSDARTVVADAIVGTKTVDIMLCLDASRSMNRTSTARRGFPPGATSINQPPLPGSRWFELKATVRSFQESLTEINPNARIGLVTFGGGLVSNRLHSELDDDWARLETELTLVASSEALEISDKLDSYATDYPALGFGTSIYDGVDFSIKAFDNPDATRHIVLLSDGLQVARGRPSATTAALDALDKGITIHSISFGGNLAALNAMSELTGGSNFTALSEIELQEAFNRLLGSFRVQLAN